jgi:uncharacterized protein (TIGR02300 family)
VTKAELGTKRICTNCNLKFYDLRKNPIVCPTCKTIVEAPPPIAAKPRRAREEPAAPAQKPEIEQTPARIDSSDDVDVLTKEKNEEDDYIDEEFEKE